MQDDKSILDKFCSVSAVTHIEPVSLHLTYTLKYGTPASSDRYV
jgi:hypothetical protein